ncbi:MAG: outer membrane beta-barrel protein [Flavobacteriales bacterium]|nr:outer membrane beta-barrel protein [Flavobacteriales bacterium]MCB9205151.1 outer membrane beta-barrel protein [Flavobacteriales bacterium]
MKKFFSILFAIGLFASTANAQTVSETTVADEQPKKKRKPPKKEMILVNLNFDSWLFNPSTVKPKWFASRGVDVALLYDYVLAKSNFSLAGGVGFNSHNIHMEAFPIVYQITEGHSYTHLDPTFFEGQKITVNKISTNFIDIPFEVRFRSNPHKNGKRIAASVGFKLGWLVQSHTKSKTDEDYFYEGVNFRRKIKTYDIPNLTKFRYGLTARVGYANFYLNFFYSLTPLFREGYGTEAVPISIGIGVSPF